MDTARDHAGRTADWTATAANNTSSPATFYAILPENTNSVVPGSALLTAGQAQQFQPAFTVAPAGSPAVPLTFLGSVQTPSPAASVAVNGDTAYVCDNNEISLIDIANPAAPRFVGGRAPALAAFDLSNPREPQLLSTSPVGARFFRSPVYSGNTVFMPASLVQLFMGNVDGSYGQVFAIDVTDFSHPTILSALLSASRKTGFIGIRGRTSWWWPTSLIRPP